MQVFIRRLFWFLLPLPFLWTTLILFAQPYFDSQHNQKSNENTVFLWGDSQLHRGIDLAYLEQLTGLQVHSASEHGAGVYDFLVFVEKVPFESNVILSISKTAQLRRKSKDRNMAGVSFSAIKELYYSGYNLSDIGRILAKNPKPVSLFRSENPMYPAYSKSFKEADSILFESIYSSVPPYTKLKQGIYLNGLRTLLAKKCRILFVEFPYHTVLEQIESRSEVKSTTDEFASIVADELNVLPRVFDIADEDEFMHDYTHLDEIGARLVSEEIAEVFSSGQSNSYVIIK